MITRTTDVAIGAAVLIVAIGGVAHVLLRGDACRDKAQAFIVAAPAVSAKVGKVSSAETSFWLSGQTVAPAGERSFYFLVKGERGRASAVVGADRATCTCRIESLN